MKKILLLLLSSILFTSISAQMMNDINVIEMKAKVTDCLNRYTNTIQKMQFKQQEMEFLSLFDKQANIYDDLFGISYKENLTVLEYAHIMATRVFDYQIEISDIVLSEPLKKKDQWVITATFKKDVAYKNEYGVMFHPRSYYKEPFRLTAEFTFANDKSDPKITNIKGSTTAGIKRPHQSFCIIERKDGLDEVRVDGFYPTYNSDNQAFTTDNAILSCDNPNLTVKRSYMSADAHIIKYNVRARRFVFKPYFGFGLGNSSSVAGSNIDSQKSSFMDFGLDFGVNILGYRRFRLYGFTGFAMEKNNIDITLKGKKYSYETDQDVHGDKYIRQYSNVNIDQTSGFFDYAIPVYADMEIPLSQTFCFYADLGAIFSIAGNSSVNSLNGSFNVTGLYPQYENLKLDYTSGINGFVENGKVNEENQSLSYNSSRNSNPIKLMTQVGFRVRIWESLFFDFSARYMRNIKSTTSNGATDIYPLRYDVRNNTETINAFGSESSSPSNQVSLTASIVYKL